MHVSMSNILLEICNKLGVDYPDLGSYSNDCDKSKYLLLRILAFIG